MPSASTFRKSIEEKYGAAANWALWLMSLSAAIAALVPFSPEMPAGGLDQSWVFAMNQVVSQGLAFGEDIIFTYGPYAAIYSKAYHPSTDFMMISGSLYLALSYWACFVFLMKGVQRFWSLAFCIILAGIMFLHDPLFFSLPLLVGLVSFKIIFSEEGGGLAKSKFAPVYVALLFAPLGLLTIIKGSMLVPSAAVVALCAIFFASKRKTLAAICICSPVVSMLIFWIASGQSAATLPNYLTNLAPVMSGYTEAMATDGNIREIVLYLITSAFLLLAIITQKELTNAPKVFLFGLYFAFLFVAFKAGFVRHDGHAIISATSLMFAAILLPFVLQNRIVFLAIIFSVATCNYINNHYLVMSAESVANNIKSTYSSAWQGIENRIKNRNGLKNSFDAAVNTLREQASFPALQGTTDIYSYNQSYLIASGNTWSPRPVFQSFAAYSPVLAEANRRHLLGKQAPENVIFKVEAIDGRIPSVDDGASWPVFLYNYEPTRMVNGFLFLRKKETVSEVPKPLKLTSEKHTLGEQVRLPSWNQPIFAQIEIEPTIFGRLASILFKPSYLVVTLEMENGGKSQYRIIAGMVKSGFVISPLIENTTDFGMLYAKDGLLDSKRVKSMAITSSDNKIRHWKKEYAVTFSQVETASPVDISGIGVFDGFDDRLAGSEVAIAKKCDGVVDLINNIPPASVKYPVSNSLEVVGWLAASVDKGTVPESVYVVLTDSHGNHTYLRTRRMYRPDVGAHFNKAELNESGFRTIADITATRKGQYTLGLAMVESNRIEICPQFDIPIKITK